MKHLRWAFWSVYYSCCPWSRPPDMEGILQQYLRVRPPWWKWKPTIWHNSDGGQWHISFTDDQDYVKSWVPVICDIHLDFETQTKIVGLTIYDENLLFDDTDPKPVKGGDA